MTTTLVLLSLAVLLLGAAFMQTSLSLRRLLTSIEIIRRLVAELHADLKGTE